MWLLNEIETVVHAVQNIWIKKEQTLQTSANMHNQLIIFFKKKTSNLALKTCMWNKTKYRILVKFGEKNYPLVSFN